MRAEFKCFYFFNKIKRVLAYIGAVFNKRFENVIDEGGDVLLGGADVGCYEAGWVIFRGFLGFDGGVSGGGGRS